MGPRGWGCSVPSQTAWGDGSGGPCLLGRAQRGRPSGVSGKEKTLTLTLDPPWARHAVLHQATRPKGAGHSALDLGECSPAPAGFQASEERWLCPPQGPEHPASDGHGCAGPCGPRELP